MDVTDLLRGLWRGLRCCAAFLRAGGDARTWRGLKCCADLDGLEVLRDLLAWTWEGLRCCADLDGLEVIR